MGAIAVQSGTRQVGKSRWQGLRTTLVALVIISLIATVIFVVGFFVPGAIVAAMFVGLFYGLLVAVRVLDRPARGSEAEAAAARAAETDSGVHDFSPDIPRSVIVAERAGLRIGLIILVPMVVAAVILAGVFVGWKVIGLGSLAFFAIMVFFGAPVWVAALEDEIEEDEEKEGFKQEAIR